MKKMKGQENLERWMEELLAEMLTPVEPSPRFVQALGQDLVRRAARQPVRFVERYRRMIVVGLAALGSALSLAGLLLFYLLRGRARKPALQA